MNERERALLDLTGKPVSSLLEELATLRDREKQGEKLVIPLVTLHLRTGRDVRGFILKVTDDRHAGKLVLVHVPGSDRGVEYDVMYLSAGSVEAITMHDVPGLSKAPEAGTTPPPTRLDLKRRLAALQASFTEKVGTAIACEISWDAVPESGEPLRSLADLLEQTSAVVEQVAKDEMGLTSMKAKLKKVWFGIGSAPSAALQGDTLIVTTTPGWTGRLTRPAILKAVEAGL